MFLRLDFTTVTVASDKLQYVEQLFNKHAFALTATLLRLKHYAMATLWIFSLFIFISVVANKLNTIERYNRKTFSRAVNIWQFVWKIWTHQLVKSRFKFWVEDFAVSLNNFKNHDFFFVYAELNTFVLVALWKPSTVCG